jgi:hypothetical protein
MPLATALALPSAFKVPAMEETARKIALSLTQAK